MGNSPSAAKRGICEKRARLDVLCSAPREDEPLDVRADRVVLHRLARTLAEEGGRVEERVYDIWTLFNYGNLLRFLARAFGSCERGLCRLPEGVEHRVSRGRLIDANAATLVWKRPSPDVMLRYGHTRSPFVMIKVPPSGAAAGSAGPAPIARYGAHVSIYPSRPDGAFSGKNLHFAFDHPAAREAMGRALGTGQHHLGGVLARRVGVRRGMDPLALDAAFLYELEEVILPAVLPEGEEGRRHARAIARMLEAFCELMNAAYASIPAHGIGEVSEPAFVDALLSGGSVRVPYEGSGPPAFVPPAEAAIEAPSAPPESSPYVPPGAAPRGRQAMESRSEPSKEDGATPSGEHGVLPRNACTAMALRVTPSEAKGSEEEGQEGQAGQEDEEAVARRLQEAEVARERALREETERAELERRREREAAERRRALEAEEQARQAEASRLAAAESEARARSDREAEAAAARESEERARRAAALEERAGALQEEAGRLDREMERLDRELRGEDCPSLSELGQSGGRRRPAGSASFQGSGAGGDPVRMAAFRQKEVMAKVPPLAGYTVSMLAKTSRELRQEVLKYCRMLLGWERLPLVSALNDTTVVQAGLTLALMGKASGYVLADGRRLRAPIQSLPAAGPRLAELLSTAALVHGSLAVQQGVPLTLLQAHMVFPRVGDAGAAGLEELPAGLARIAAEAWAREREGNALEGLEMRPSLARPGLEKALHEAAYTLGRFMLNGWGIYDDVRTEEEAVAMARDIGQGREVEALIENGEAAGRFRLTPAEFVAKLLYLRLLVGELFRAAEPAMWPSLARDLVLLTVGYRPLLCTMLRTAVACELPLALAALVGDGAAELLMNEGQLKRAFFLLLPNRLRRVSLEWLGRVVEVDRGWRGRAAEEKEAAGAAGGGTPSPAGTGKESERVWEYAAGLLPENVPEWNKWGTPQQLLQIADLGEARVRGFGAGRPGGLTPSGHASLWKGVMAAADVALRWNMRMDLLQIVDQMQTDIAGTQRNLERQRAEAAERSLRASEEAAALRKQAAAILEGREGASGGGSGAETGVPSGAARRKKKGGRGRRG
jgi:hypothetical protein